MMSRDPADRLGMSMLLVTLLMSTIAMMAIAWRAWHLAEKIVADEARLKTIAVGRSLALTFERADEAGIPIAEIPGVTEQFDEVRGRHAEVARIAFRPAASTTAAAPESQNAAAATAVVIPIRTTAGASGFEIQVEQDPRYAASQYRGLLLDFLIMLVAAVFLTRELIAFFAGTLALAPLRHFLAGLAALEAGRVASPVPATDYRPLRMVAEALRARQSETIAAFRFCRARLRQQLSERWAARRADMAYNDSDLRIAITELRALRTRFGLFIRPDRHVAADPSPGLGAIRMPLLLFLLAEDFSRGFLPGYAAALAHSTGVLAPNVATGLPIFAFMLVVALLQPGAGRWCDRRGCRPVFLWAAALGMCAHFLTAQATTLEGLIVWRTVAGVAWAMAFVSAQGAVLDSAAPSDSTKGLADLVGIIMVSMVCGPAMGGIIADGIGQRETFVLAGLLAVAAWLVGWQQLPAQSGMREQCYPIRHPTTPTQSVPVWRTLLGNPRFVALCIFAAIPAKLLLVAVCFYLVPLHIATLGGSAATAGRTIMLYSIVMVLLVPWMAEFARRRRNRLGARSYVPFVLAGGLLAGMAAMSMALPFGLTACVIAVGLIGVAQAISISSQIALLPVIAGGEIAQCGEGVVYGVYRLVERTGSALGPLVAGALLAFFGFRDAFFALGLLMLLCGGGFALAFFRRPPGNRAAGNPRDGPVAPPSRAYRET